VFTEISITAETLLDDLTTAHAEGAARVRLLVHATRDAGDVFGCGVVGEGGVCCFARAFVGVCVGGPFFEESENFDLGAGHVEGVVGGYDCTVAGAVFGGSEDAEGGADVSADDRGTC